MKNKYRIALRTLMLILISSGIFISGYHNHSDLDWMHNHRKIACTRIHFSASNEFCPICAFHLEVISVGTPSFEVSETIALIANQPFDSKKLHSFVGRITGRSPPALS